MSLVAETIPNKTIYLVEDDEVIRENLADLLAMEGFHTQGFSTPESALNACKLNLPNLVILDITLGLDHDAGFDLCRELRMLSSFLPIIFLTSHDSDLDRISGMRLGADDYLTKDTSMEYVLVRIKTLLKRVNVLLSANQPKTTIEEDQFDGLYLDDNRMLVYWKEKHVDLSLTQYWIVAALTKNVGHVRSHNQLMEAANMMVQPNTVAAHIKNIREQFIAIDPNFDCIKTERGIGYRWVTIIN